MFAGISIRRVSASPSAFATAATASRSLSPQAGSRDFRLSSKAAFEAASGRPVPYKIVPRRPGDIASCYADPVKAKTELGWTAEFGLERMMQDAWRWQSQNPMGYES